MLHTVHGNVLLNIQETCPNNKIRVERMRGRGIYICTYCGSLAHALAEILPLILYKKVNQLITFQECPALLIPI